MTAISDNHGVQQRPVADALVLHPRDNVATALSTLAAHQTIHLMGAGFPVDVTVRETIGMCHKFALRDIAEGDVVTKYGESIGRATCAIRAGEHVHTHNLTSNRAG